MVSKVKDALDSVQYLARLLYFYNSTVATK